MTWWDLFSAQFCPHCSARIKQPGHGLRRSTCEKCHATLPDALALHLDRAMHSRWYMQWFEVAMRILRLNQQAIEACPQRKPPATALPVAESAEEARR